jgi:hypothetical protein
MKKRRGFWIALVIFIGLAAYVRYYESRRVPDAPEGPAPFLAVEPTRVRAFTASWLVDTTRVEKRGGSWWIVYPIVFPADPVAVEALLSRTRDLQVMRRFPLGGENVPARYGLDYPRAWITLHLTDDSEVTLNVGAPATASPAFYVQVAGQGEVGLLQDAEVDNYFQRNTAGWRRRQLLAVHPDSALSLAMTSGDLRTVISRPDPLRPWEVVEPFPGVADNEILGDYLKGLAAMRARSYPEDRPASLAPFGLDPPLASIVVTSLGGRRDTLDLGSAYRVPTGEERYARINGFRNLFGVPAGYLGVATRSDFFFRLHRIFRVAVRHSSALVFRSGADSVVVMPDSAGVWHIPGEATTPGAAPPDRSELVAGWIDAQADSIAPAAGPFDPASATFTVEVRSGSRIERVAVLRPGRSGTGAEFWPARLIFSDLPRPGEVFHLSPELVRTALALLEQG